MNRGQLRAKIAEFSKRLERGAGAPTDAEIHEGRKLLLEKGNFLSDMLPSNVEFKARPEPNWESRSSVAETFKAYHSALADIDKKQGGAIENRLHGI